MKLYFCICILLAGCSFIETEQKSSCSPQLNSSNKLGFSDAVIRDFLIGHWTWVGDYCSDNDPGNISFESDGTMYFSRECTIYQIGDKKWYVKNGNLYTEYEATYTNKEGGYTARDIYPIIKIGSESTVDNNTKHLAICEPKQNGLLSHFYQKH